ncbi:hypothetical protein KPL71_003292 [Citrus sinensis]|uniref:Uncharacterized protein n=1 Tax=Citrus sinensis TaxID=2711 RepID=A0ACB8MXM5_CITSI|nr:hypothetical protein KPL71_003292 [Citrus sinensis]
MSSKFRYKSFGIAEMNLNADEDEAEVWFSGLKALISRNHHRKWRTESRSDGIPSEANSPRTYTRRSSPLNSPFGSNDSLQKAVVSRATSSISRRPSPPRLTTPTPTLGGLASPKIVVDDAKRTNDSLSQENADFSLSLAGGESYSESSTSRG